MQAPLFKGSTKTTALSSPPSRPQIPPLVVAATRECKAEHNTTTEVSAASFDAKQSKHKACTRIREAAPKSEIPKSCAGTNAPPHLLACPRSKALACTPGSRRTPAGSGPPSPSIPCSHRRQAGHQNHPTQTNNDKQRLRRSILRAALRTCPCGTPGTRPRTPCRRSGPGCAPSDSR